MTAPTNIELADQIGVLRRIVSSLTSADVRTDAEIAQADKDAADAEKQLAKSAKTDA